LLLAVTNEEFVFLKTTDEGLYLQGVALPVLPEVYGYED